MTYKVQVSVQILEMLGLWYLFFILSFFFDVFLSSCLQRSLPDFLRQMSYLFMLGQMRFSSLFLFFFSFISFSLAFLLFFSLFFSFSVHPIFADQHILGSIDLHQESGYKRVAIEKSEYYGSRVTLKSFVKTDLLQQKALHERRKQKPTNSQPQ